MQGSLKDLYERWRMDLVKVQKTERFYFNFIRFFFLKSLAHAEAYIDFHEDQHIENDILTEGMQIVLWTELICTVHICPKFKNSVFHYL